jgi:hypothetical protein
MLETVQTAPSAFLAGLAGNPPADATRGDGGTLFQREVAAAVERAGGARARDERAQDLSTARRGRREEGFERYDERVDDERRAGRADGPRAARAPQPDVDAAREPQPAADAARTPADGATASLGAERADSSGARAPATRPAPAPDDVARFASPPPAAASSTSLAPQTGLQPAAAAHAPAGLPSAKAPTLAPSAAPSPRSAVPAELSGAPRNAPAGTAVLERAEEILRQIRLAIQPNAKRVVLELEPHDLGRMSIRMSLHRGELATVVRVESPETLGLLEQRAQELRSLLAERGFDTTRTTLELGFGAQRHAPRRDLDPGRTRGDAAPSDSRRAEPLPTACPRTDGIDTYA